MIKILDFWAEWCGPCKFMEPIIEELEHELKDKITVEKINVDEEQEKASKYGVMSIPTYVFEKDEKELERLVGATQKDNFLKILKKYE